MTYLRQVIIALAVAFSTWLAIGAAAALLGVANYAAALAGQASNCAVPDAINEYVQIGQISLGLGVLLPASVFGICSVVLVVWPIVRGQGLKVKLLKPVLLGFVLSAVAILGIMTLTESAGYGTEIFLENASLEETVIVYVEDASQVPLMQRFAEEFEARYPEVKVFVIWPGCCLPRPVMNENVDIITGSDLSVAMNLAERGVLTHYISPQSRELFDWARDSGNHWVAQGIFVEVMVINAYVLIETEAPKSWSDLLDPKWEGRIVLTRVTRKVSDATFSTIASVHGIQYWEDLKKQEPLVARSFSESLTLISNRTYWLTPYAPLSEYLKPHDLGASLRYIIPNEGLPIRISWIAISSAAPHPNAAKLWYEFALSTDGQKLWQEIYGGLSARRDRPPSENGLMPIYEAILEGRFVQPDWSHWVRDRESHVNIFGKIFGVP